MSAPTSLSRARAEEVIMTLASGQHGVVARGQLMRAGVSADTLDHRVRAGRLRKLHRGVYLVGPLSAAQTRAMAAVLACGQGAVIGRRSAASLWRMLPAVSEEEPVEVLGAHRAMSRPGIRVRRTGPLEHDEVTVRDSIPITTPERTLYDLAGLVSDRELERSVGETFALRLAQRPRILALLDRYAGRRGATRLRRLLQEESSLALCRSEAEERFLELIRKAGLAGVQANVTVAGHKVDFVWRTERLVVEIDGRAFHSTKRKFEGDRRRDADLVAAGLRVIRVTWHQIMNEPEVLIARLAQALVRPMQL